MLQVDSGREWRGGQNQVRLLCRELARRPEVEQWLATKHGSELARRAGAEGVRVHGLSWSMGVDPRAVLGLAALIQSFRPDVIHVHDSHALSVTRGALWWRRGASRPAVVASRRVDFHVRSGSGWFRVDRIVAVSEAVKRVLVADGVPGPSIAVVHDGIDPAEIRRGAAATSDIRAALGLPAQVPLAVNVAALVDHKDQRTLIQAAAAARGKAPDLHWVVAGDGPLRESLAREVARLGVADRVHLVGFVEQVDALIAEARVFVMSSKEEGMGSVVLHALALGRPVVATAAGGLAEIVPPRWLVPVGDAEALGRRVAESAATPPSPLPYPAALTAAAMADAVLALYRPLV